MEYLKVNEQLKTVIINNDLDLVIGNGVFYSLNKNKTEIEIYNFDPQNEFDDLEATEILDNARENCSFKISLIKSFPTGHNINKIDFSNMIKKSFEEGEEKFKEELYGRIVPMIGKYKEVQKVIIDKDELKIGYHSKRKIIGDIPLMNEQIVEFFIGFIITNKGVYSIVSHYDYFFGMPNSMEKFMDDILKNVEIHNSDNNVKMKLDTELQKENEDIMREIIEVLTDNARPMTINELHSSSQKLNEITNQKLCILLKKLINDNKIAKTKNSENFAMFYILRADSCNQQIFH